MGQCHEIFNLFVLLKTFYLGPVTNRLKQLVISKHNMTQNIFSE